MGFLSNIGGMVKKAGAAAGRVTSGIQSRIGKIQKVANRASGLASSVSNVADAGAALGRATTQARGVFSRRGR